MDIIFRQPLNQERRQPAQQQPGPWVVGKIHRWTDTKRAGTPPIWFDVVLVRATTSGEGVEETVVTVCAEYMTSFTRFQHVAAKQQFAMLLHRTCVQWSVELAGAPRHSGKAVQ